MFRLNVSQTRVSFPIVRKAGWLVLLSLLTMMVTWLLFRTLSPAHAGGSFPSMPMETEGPAPSAVAGDAPLTLAWSAFRDEDTFSVAWGDADGDGDLDLAVGSGGKPIRLYQNQGAVGGELQLTPVYTAPVADDTRSVAWGDYDNDGDLDLAVGNGPDSSSADQYNRIYRNDGIVTGVFQMALVWTASISDTTHSVAWGDYDGDGDLDLAVGNAGRYSHGCYCFSGGYNRLYRNDGVVADVPQMTLVWTAPMTDTTRSVAWGDWDNDGDLDLAVGNAKRPNRVYRNVGGATPLELSWTASVTDSTHSVAWGDYDGDGDLDLAVGNGSWISQAGEPNRIYRNFGTGLTSSPVYTTTESEPTHSVAWGDYDGDGHLDLAVGNYRAPNQLYRNDGGYTIPTFTLVWSTSLEESTQSVAWGDLDSDGDLDLAVGNSIAPNRMYRNEGTALTASPAWSSNELDTTRSLAWGDYDNDGDLDLAVGNRVQPNRVYHNTGGMLATDAAWTAPITDGTTSVAWGDYDNDGDLDLAVGNSGQPNRLYRNVGGATLFTLVSWPVDAQNTRSIAWGDYDNDGDLDLAVGNRFGQSYLYRNVGGTLEATPSWQSELSASTMSVAWGDVDNDGDLDLAVGSDGNPTRLYRNDGGILTTSAVWSSGPSETTMSVAWGDVDGDGDLDLAVGNESAPNRLYRNDNGALTVSPVWSSIEADSTYSLAWGDYDGDGDLDLATGSAYGGNPGRLYRNDDGALTPGAVWSSPSVTGNYPPSVAWGDVDGDGDLDLAVGYGYQLTGYRNRLYLNSRDARSGPASIPVVSVRRPSPPGNADGYSSAVVWSGGTISIPYTLSDPESDPVKFIRAWYSPDGGGHWLPAVASSDAVTTDLATFGYGLSFDGVDDGVDTPLNINQSSISSPGATMMAWVYPTSTSANRHHVISTDDADFDWSILRQGGTWYVFTGEASRSTGFSVDPNQWQHVAAVFDPGTGVRFYKNGQQVTIPYIAYDTSDSNVGIGYNPGWGEYFEGQIDEVRVYTRTLATAEIQTAMTQTSPGTAPGLVGYWRFNEGEGSTAYDQTPLHNDGTLVNGPVWTTVAFSYMYNWDVWGSGFFGQSDNVAFRIQAVPAIVNRPDAIPGPYLYGAYASQSFPFRVRGTQVRVLSDTIPVANALVYQLPAEQTMGGTLIADSAGNPFRTDSQGYLQGRGQLDEGDQLMALLPITWTENYTVYLTSGTPTLTGVNADTVVGGGVQTLTVSADNPLILFNLNVSLEWDAHNETAYLDQLAFNLQRASEHLYDFTNGQAALGNVNVFQNADEWVYSHVVVQANNRLRPFAAQGGVVFTDTVDPQHNTVSDTILYVPGQVTMGSTWNRYGNPGQSLGEDWPIILAHELSHYLLFHDDTYIGMDPNGFLVPISTCLGSAMGDLYSGPENTEFIAGEGYWQANCADTLAEQTLERNEWETMELWYPGLVTPTAILSGPTTMPFDFTAVAIHDPYTPTNTLVDPTFYIDYQGGGGSSSEARAYLDRDEYVVNLGSPFGGQNRVIAHGAKPGDRLCVFDRPRAQFGCETIEIGDDSLAMRLDADWNPIVQISPINSTTLTIHFSNTVPISFPLYARIFPDLGYGEAPIPLTLVGGVYSGTFELTYPAMSGNVQVWVDEPFTETDPRREAIVAYSIGGNPGTMRGAGGTMRGAGGTMRGAGGTMRGAGGTMRGAGAPIISPDGQMIFFTENPIDFSIGTFFTIQGMAGLPPLPPGRTLVGQGYNLVASPGMSLPTGSVSIQYLSNDVLVAGASEADLTLYYWDGVSWAALNTVLDTYFNLASAPSQGEGVYALMASMRVPLYAPGWNLFAYPLQTAQPVSDALRSIEGYYATVYGYRAEDNLDPWEVYQVGGPAYLNDLSELEPARGYWISATQAITIYLSNVMDLRVQDGPPASPPDTYYGTITGSATFTPVAGMEVRAWIGGVSCGRGLTQECAGQVVYVVDVMADDGVANVGCGQLGRRVVLAVDGQQMVPTILWDNSQLNEIPLTPASVVYLPLVMRNH